MKIPLAKPEITSKDKDMVLKVLNSSHLALGPTKQEFEKKIADYTGTKYAVAVNSGTSGLHLVIKALGIKKGDQVITTPFSFISSANCILYEKAKPVFVDIRPDNFNINTNLIEKAITKDTKAILAVDVFGYPADWDKLKEIAKKYNLKLIEDSAESLGSEYKNKKCGSLADAAVFSFYPNKQITTGEGGIVVTNKKYIAKTCRSLANQGRRIKNRKWLEHLQLGYNYRMSEIAAALGISQLSRINKIIKERKQIANLYNKKLKKIPGLIIPTIGQDINLNWFVYVVRLSDNFSAKDRGKIIKKLETKGIQCSNYFQAIHLQPFYKRLFHYKKGDFPIAEFVSERTIALPFYNQLKEKNIDYIAKSLKNIFLPSITFLK